MSPNTHPADRVATTDTAALHDLGEWAALGFMEAEGMPWPRAYGRAFRSLYEHMEVRVLPEHLLIPCEPFPSRTTMAQGGTWYATGFILDFDHNRGLRVNREIATLKQAEFPQYATFIERLVSLLEARLGLADVSVGYTHSNPDIRRVVGEGFDAMEAELECELAAARSEHLADDSEPVALLLALKDYTAGVRAFHGRAVEAAWNAHEFAKGQRRQELAMVAGALAHGFLQPAGSFLEGLLAVNLAWMLDGCDSIGRIDQVLGPLFDRDLAAGTLGPEFARRLLDEWWQQFEALNGWNLQIGGRTREGHDGCNALTRELIRACGRNHLRRPNVAFRVTVDTPPDMLQEALEVLAHGSGRPALYNDDLYIRSLLDLDLGLVPEDACEIGFGGCTETMIGGLSNVGSLEGHLNFARWLELALYDGRDPVSGRQIGPHTGELESFDRFEDLLDAYRRQVEYGTQVFVEARNRVLGERFHRWDPKLYRTFFTRDCVRRRKSFEAGGARYNWAVVSYAGISNTIDSLAAIRRCVFEERSMTAEELRVALQKDFQGCEDLRQRLLAVPKFGNDEGAVDALGHEVLTHAWRFLLQHRTPRGGRYVPSCILFATYEGQGREVGATPDGRRAFTVLSDSVGPTPGRDSHGPTAVLNSVLALPLTLAAGTPVLNLRFQKPLLGSEGGLRALAALIRSFFERGGMQVQLTVVSTEELRAAQREPEGHQGLIVRIGGYSEYFTRLSPALQESVIERTEYHP